MEVGVPERARFHCSKQVVGSSTPPGVESTGDSIMSVTLAMVSGRVFAEDAAGAVRPLSVGDTLGTGDTVLTGDASAARFLVEGEGGVTLGAHEQWDPSDGPPPGGMYEAPAHLAPLRTEVLPVDNAAPHFSADSLAGWYAEEVSHPAIAADPLPGAEAGDPASVDWLAQAEGSIRALKLLTSSTAGTPDHAEVARAVAELSGWQEGEPFPEEALDFLFSALDRAGDVALQSYARGAGESLRDWARGSDPLQAERFEGALEGVVPAEELVQQPAPASEEAGMVLDVSGLLDEVSVGPLGDLLQVDSLAGVARVTMPETNGDESTTLWLDDPVGAVGSLLGFDAPEFAFAGSDAY